MNRIDRGITVPIKFEKNLFRSAENFVVSRSRRAVPADGTPHRRLVKATVESKQQPQPDLARLRANDQKEWQTWMTNLHNSLMGIAINKGLSHEDAEDVIQQVWIALINNIDNLAHEENLNGHVGKSVINKAHDFLRDQGRRKDTSELSDAVVTKEIDPNNPLDEAIVQEETVQTILKCLSPTHRAILTYLTEGYSVEEVMTMTGASEKDIYTARQQAAIILRQSSDFEADISVERDSEDIAINEDVWLERLDPFSLSTNIRLIRIYLEMNEKEFADAIHIAKDTLYRIETERRSPNQSTTNSIIEVSPLDPEGKAAHLLRAQADGLDVMTVEKLQVCPLGELLYYLRILKGQYPKEFATAVGVARERVVEWEAGTVTPTERLEDIIRAFDFLPDSIIPDIIRFKATHEIEVLPAELIAKVRPKKEKYLITDESKKEQQEKKEIEKRWLRTIRKVGIAKALRYLRESEGMSRDQVAQESGISDTEIYEIEAGLRKPNLNTLNMLISVQILDSQGKAAQMLRLQSYNRDIMTIQALQFAPIGKVIQYLRILKGVTQQEMARDLGRVPLTIKRWEGGKVNIPVEGLEEVISWFGIDENSSLAQIMRKKQEDPRIGIQKSLLFETLFGSYLFVDANNLEDDYFKTVEEKRLLAQVALLGSESVRIWSSVLATVTQSNPGIITEAGIQLAHIPLDKIILRFAEMLGGYKIHNDITHVLLDAAERQRRKNDSG